MKPIIDGIEMQSPIMNASGCHCTTRNELNELDNSSAGAVISKSCTINSRIGNDLPRYYDTSSLSINSTGLANEGWEYYSKIKLSKPYIISVAGIEKGDNIYILKQLQECYNCDMIELNLSCPNIIGKPQIGYDFEDSYELLRQVFEFNEKKIGIKLPPYFDMIHFNYMSDILNEFTPSYITCINSLGNGFVFDDDFKPSIVPKNGYGGIGGSIIKPFGLSNVRHFHELLPNLNIIGCGGIIDSRDVKEYLISGAKMVQIGTQLVKEGPSCFKRIIDEFTYINFI